MIFSMFTKRVTMRLNSMADHVINSFQNAFMKRKNNLEGVVMLHETVHELHNRKQNKNHLDHYIEIFGYSIREFAFNYLGRQLTLINLVLSSLRMFMMFIFNVPMESYESWTMVGLTSSDRKTNKRKNIVLLISGVSSTSGLNIHDLGTKNIVLLSKWLCNLLILEGPWQQKICDKRSNPLSQVEWRLDDLNLKCGVLSEITLQSSYLSGSDK
ncbi:hypothetical protein U9M48_002355 [Paspalum notatum var. saurae]|uniref:Uncharacterized protein n=1 Tax=Paspalum notatum var. saurae TaxID=547442 RepID=A0AAQ3PHM5_PASNO